MSIISFVHPGEDGKLGIGSSGNRTEPAVGFRPARYAPWATSPTIVDGLYGV